MARGRGTRIGNVLFWTSGVKLRKFLCWRTSWDRFFGLVLITAFASVSEANTFLSFDDFKTLSPADRAEYMDGMRALVLSHGREVRGDGAAGIHWMDLFVEHAWATQDQGVCIYAGHLSTYDSRGLCLRPRSLMSQEWRMIAPDGREIRQPLCGGQGQILCNPLIYGFGPYNASTSSYSGMCVSSVATATSDCERLYQELPNYKAQHVANQIVSSGMGSQFNEMSAQTAEYCARLPEGHRQVPLCEVVRRRTDFLRSRVAQAARASPESLARGLPHAAESPPREEGIRPRAQGTNSEVVPVPPPRPPNLGARSTPVEADERDCNCGVDQARATEGVARAATDLRSIQENLCRPDSAARPQPGARAQLTSSTYGIFGLMGGAMENLMRQAQQGIERARGVTDGCPQGCNRVNRPRVVVDTAPSGTSPVADCPSQPRAITFTAAEIRQIAPGVSVAGDALVRQFQGSGSACDDSLRAWMSDTLRGNSPLGRQVNSVKCAGECGLSNSLELTNAGQSGRCDLSVRWVIRCGPPKRRAEWTSDVSLVHDWSCQPREGR